MKAALIHRTGSASELQVTDIPMPEVGPGEIRVKVAAAAVNPVDVQTRSDSLDLNITFPSVLGWDVAGTVDAVGAGVTRFHEGDLVMGMIAQHLRTQGTYAEYVSSPRELFALVPEGISLQQAAAAPLVVLTAAQMLNEISLPEKADVLVTGAAGGVGRVAVQLLLQDGHKVAGLARPSDTDDLTALGVAAVYDTAASVPAKTFDAVFDCAGIAGTIASVRDGGGFVSIVNRPQPEPENGIVPKMSFVQENGEQLGKLAQQIARGTLTVPIGHTYPLSQVDKAHADFEQGGMRGKVLLIP
ncbi:MAG: oxidoreductase [Gammaproteobacteria bacterium]|nr:MAG: oxidoreductase [Gammaproteobacteria bacterium]